MKKKKHEKKERKNKYTLNIKKMFKEAVDCNFRKEVDDEGKKTGKNPFDEILFFIKEDLNDTFLSIKKIANNHGRKSIINEDIIEYYGFKGRPKLYEK